MASIDRPKDSSATVGLWPVIFKISIYITTMLTIIVAVAPPTIKISGKLTFGILDYNLGIKLAKSIVTVPPARRLARPRDKL